MNQEAMKILVKYKRQFINKYGHEAYDLMLKKIEKNKSNYPID